jgi:serine/threonine-protein kinase
MSEIDPGTVIDGRYKVMHRLGSGGMADVFCAEDQQLGRNIALKLLHRRFAEDPGFVERFRREAQSAAGLQHPNVVSVYDRGSYGGTYYIAMEYLQGKTLKRLIREEAPLDPVRAIDIAIQILKAARFAHRRGVVHRDLKPHNVMIDEQEHAKVTDFGIARAGASDMTETGSIMGTAQYLSPEQAQGMAVSASSDLYSVGVVLYELLTGRVPFDGESAVTIALKHVSEAPTPLHLLNPRVPPELEQVVLWALNKDPADRPADADQLIAALQAAREAIVSGSAGQRTADMPALAFAAGAAGAAGMAGAGAARAAEPRTTVQPPRDHHGAEAAAAYAAAAGAGAVAADVLEDGSGPHEVLPPAVGEDRPRRASPRWPWLLLAILIVAAAGAATYFLTRPAQRTVPNVVGQTLDVGQSQLQNAGFAVSVVQRPDPRAAAGIIITQSPLGGQKADKDSTVTLTVSTGPSPVSVPSVAGLPRRDALNALRHAGLKVARVISQNSSTVAQGVTINTDPAAGTSIAPGQGVTLFISSGPAPVNVPSVVGNNRTDAESKLSALGLNVTTTTQQTTTAAPDTVVSQSVTGKAPAGSTVNLVVAQAPPSVPVPDVTGQTAAAAARTLKAAGFKVTQAPQPTTDQAQNGIVLSESPVGGTQAPKGTTVKLTVGHYQASTTPTPTTPTPTTPTTPTTTTPAQ